MTDEKLMILVRDDELSYLSELFERYHVRLYNYFRKVTRDPMLSEDLTQSVFERIIHYRHTYGNTSSFQGWIFRIAKNCLIDHHRKRNLVDSNADIQTLERPEEYGDDEIEKLNENKSRLSRAIEQLKEEHREVIVLSRLENLTYQEIGQSLGLSETAVKARMFRAMKNLKKHFFQINESVQ